MYSERIARCSYGHTLIATAFKKYFDTKIQIFFYYFICIAWSFEKLYFSSIRKLILWSAKLLNL